MITPSTRAPINTLGVFIRFGFVLSGNSFAETPYCISTLIEDLQATQHASQPPTTKRTSLKSSQETLHDRDSTRVACVPSPGGATRYFVLELELTALRFVPLKCLISYMEHSSHA